MAYEMRDGQGSLFKNNKREKETHPNARGECLIGGVVYQISAWTKKDKNGNPWQSLQFQVKGERSVPAAAPQKPAGRFDDMNDDVPF